LLSNTLGKKIKKAKYSRKFSGETYMKAVVANFGAGIIFCRFNFNSLKS